MAKKFRKETMLDLLVNAGRRLDECRFDDAVARLYRLLEFMAQARLYNEYDIETGAVRPEQVPESDLKEQVFSGGTVEMQLGLRRAYELLSLLNDDWGRRFDDIWGELRKYLDIRNGSILAHGFQPVDEHKTRKMFEHVSEFLLGCIGAEPDAARSLFVKVSPEVFQGGVRG